MASLNEHDKPSTDFSHARSKIIVLKVGDALSPWVRGVLTQSLSGSRSSKVVAIGVLSEQLENLSHRSSHLNRSSKASVHDSNGAGEAMAERPKGRPRRSAVSVSETGSPLRSVAGQSIQEWDEKQVTINSNQQVDTASALQGSPDDTNGIRATQLSLDRKMSPPVRDQMSSSSSKWQTQSLSFNQRIGLLPPDWNMREPQFQRHSGLSADRRQQGSSSRIDRQTWDTRISWPIGSTPSDDLSHPLGSHYAPLPYDLLANDLSSSAHALMGDRHLLAATISTTFAAEGWDRSLNTGIYDLPTSAATTSESEDLETYAGFKERLMCVFQQMMFVSGETAEASPETTGMIEEIVRAQVIEMLKQASDLANRRGVRSISTADLIFLIRHDKAKVSRLKTFLSWKDVRKNVKESDEKGGGDAGEVDFDDGANLPGAGPVDSKKAPNKKAKLILPWEVQSFYSEQVPERDDEEDNEEEEEQNEATLARLASADERTKNMTRDEYVYWSDCRQASFTFRKGKRFREWAGFGVVTDSKPNDDIVDILGFLTFEIVQTLTEEALKVKAAEDLHNARTSSAAGGETKKRKREGSSLFEMPEEGRTPVEPKHVREAFRRLQILPKKYSFMRPGYTGIKTPLRLI